MNVNGRAGIILPHGVLFRGGAEGKIREEILKNDLVDTIISMPSKLFYGTGIPVAIWILNRNKPTNKKNKVLIIDAENDFLEGKNQNTLRKQDIEKIITAYDKYVDVDKYAKIVDLQEIEKNEYNLNVKKYIHTENDRENIDVNKVWLELKALKLEQEEAEKDVEKLIKELGYEK
jgi:type I restriction enzyme M protein